MSKTKRLLSLALCVVMAFGIFATSASAAAKSAKDAYSDYASIKYKEATDVLLHIGVFAETGSGDGAFKPEGTLTKAMAAKMIYVLATASSQGDTLYSSTPFSDVAADYWASGYIAWGAKNGIINGNGAGQYKPESEVTVVQFLKMALTALGWGANGEFTGSAWDMNVIAKATELGLWGGIGALIDTDAKKAATREQAAEISLQTLQQELVYWGITPPKRADESR